MLDKSADLMTNITDTSADVRSMQESSIVLALCLLSELTATLGPPVLPEASYRSRFTKRSIRSCEVVDDDLCTVMTRLYKVV